MRLSVVTAVALIGTAVLVGCQSDDPPAPRPDPWSGVVSDLRVQWAAASGVDLLTGAAVPLRAYLESRLLAQSTGSIDHTYPGFTRAVPEDEPDGPTKSAWARRPPLDTPATSPLVGNGRYFVQSIQEVNTEWVATVCNYIYGVAEQRGDAFESVAGWSPDPGRGIITMRVTLREGGGQAASTLPPQSGPSAAPSNDVFGDWQVLGFLTAADGAIDREWPTFAEDRARCVAEAPDSPQQRSFLLRGEHPRDDFPTAAPDPGWPEASPS